MYRLLTVIGCISSIAHGGCETPVKTKATITVHQGVNQAASPILVDPSLNASTEFATSGAISQNGKQRIRVHGPVKLVRATPEEVEEARRTEAALQE
jgi:hypothetical protein